MIKNLLSIDPGDTTGWAWWGQDDVIHLPPKTGELKLKGRHSYEHDLFSLKCKMHDLLRECQPEVMVIEGVELWAGSLRSMTSAKRGNTFKLAYLVGVYACLGFVQGCQVRIIPARVWKGQMPLPVLEVRVNNVVGATWKSDHITNAVGLGLSVNGLLNVKERRGA